MKKWSPTGSPVTLYVAVGSNMFRPRFDERCPHSSYICNVTLHDYRFAIVTSDDPADSSASGFATVLPQAGSVVPAVLCALTPEDEKNLDGKEDVEKGDYIKMECTVITEKGHSLQALINEGLPNPGYMEMIVDGAESHGLPSDHIRNLRKIGGIH